MKVVTPYWGEFRHLRFYQAKNNQLTQTELSMALVDIETRIACVHLISDAHDQEKIMKIKRFLLLGALLGMSSTHAPEASAMPKLLCAGALHYMSTVERTDSNYREWDNVAVYWLTYCDY